MVLPGDDDLVTIELPWAVVKELAQGRMISGEVGRVVKACVGVVRSTPGALGGGPDQVREPNLLG